MVVINTMEQKNPLLELQQAVAKWDDLLCEAWDRYQTQTQKPLKPKWVEPYGPRGGLSYSTWDPIRHQRSPRVRMNKRQLDDYRYGALRGCMNMPEVRGTRDRSTLPWYMCRIQDAE